MINKFEIKLLSLIKNTVLGHKDTSFVFSLDYKTELTTGRPSVIFAYIKGVTLNYQFVSKAGF